ncbi:MAG: alpha/beta fold hydrolase [Candidatus Binataceae bacterium]
MEVALGRVKAEFERPEPVKFASPVIVLPDLFAGTRHLAVLIGYLATIGWEVYAPDLRAAAGAGSTPELSRMRFSDALDLVDETRRALGRETIIVGHGMGGLLALKLAEREGVKAAVAFAPLIPGFRTPLFMRAGNLPAFWMHHRIRPPTGRTLFELVADAEPFQRENIIKTMVPDGTAIALEVARGQIALAGPEHAAPRLIIAGDSDIFAPMESTRILAGAAGARLATLPGRGHWIIGGRALERAINEMQRFLVRALGEELLLLYSSEGREPEEE